MPPIIDDSIDESCLNCGKREVKLSTCMACKSAKYCGKECQKAHWKEHKLACKRVQNKGENKDDKEVKSKTANSLIAIGARVRCGADGHVGVLEQVNAGGEQCLVRLPDLSTSTVLLSTLEVVELPKTKSIPPLPSRSRPKGLSKLYPGPATWTLEDTQRLWPDPKTKRAVMSMLPGSLNQRESDAHWGYMHWLYHCIGPDVQTTPMPRDRHKKILRMAGWNVSSLPAGEPLKLIEVFQAMGNLVLNKKSSRSPIPASVPQQCDCCKKYSPLLCQCECGMSYCGVACHVADWKDHKQGCDMVKENSSLVLPMTQLWWQAQGVVPL